jgi:methylmalonyl-CoA/ethylmalonyl-CoA epimerase
MDRSALVVMVPTLSGAGRGPTQVTGGGKPLGCCLWLARPRQEGAVAVPARGERTVFDHVAIGTRALADGWRLFGGVLGGQWAYGGDSPGFWWGQVQFGAGPKIELLTPTGGRPAAFLERFLQTRGSGPHHLNFLVADISDTLARVEAQGIRPVQVNLENPRWKEAFLHPRDAHGIVIQVAEQSGRPPRLPPPAGFPVSGRRSAFAFVEHYVQDLDRASRLFAEALGAEVARREDGTVDLSWPDGARLRLVQAPAEGAGDGRAGAAGCLHFTRDDAPFGPDDLSAAEELSARLGICLQLGA